MGVERSVTRWYILRQPLLREISLLEEEIAQWSAPEQGVTVITPAENAAVVQKLAEAQDKLRALGPCPKPMMG